MNDVAPYTYRLFKYRSIAEHSREYTSRIIADGLIYYAEPKQFNNPFDCEFCVSMDGAPLNADGQSKRDKIKAFAEMFLRDETNDNVAVLSLSKLNDNFLIWTHYSDSHAGICLELTFETSEELYKVKYTNARPQLFFADIFEQNRDHERYRKSIIDILTTKASRWAYEHELRCIDFEGAGERLMPPGTLSGIIFGCRTSAKDKEVVQKWVESTDQCVRFSKAVQQDGTFALDIEEID